MATELALALMVAWSTPTPTRIDQAQPRTHGQQIYRCAPPLDATRKTWFENAIERILRGD